MNTDLARTIDDILNECREDGWVSVTKDTGGNIRKAIQEAKTRGWIQPRSEHSYELTSLGLEVNDCSSVESYLLIKKNKSHNSFSNQTINANNVLLDENHGTFNQSSLKESNLNPSSNKSKKSSLQHVIDIIKIIGVIIGIFAGLIAIYKFWIE